MLEISFEGTGFTPEPVPESWQQHCVALFPNGHIVTAFTAHDDEPTQVIPEVTGSYTLVIPAENLESAKVNAPIVLASYLED